ncbi:MAG: hypothetical protein ACI9G1_004451 [Pirellulaceae bacterium]|jgi:hypothetical protein
MNQASQLVSVVRRLRCSFTIHILLVCTIVSFQSLVICQPLFSQENPAAQDDAKAPLDNVERLAGEATGSIILTSEPQLVENVGALLRDVGKPEYIPFLGFFYSNLAPYGIDSDRPLVVNSFEKTGSADTLLVDIKDRVLFMNALNVTEKDFKSGKPFRLPKKPNLIFSSFEWSGVDGDTIVFGSSAEHTQAILDRDRKFPSRLPSWSREILNRCDLGMTLDVPKTLDRPSYENGSMN